MRAVGACRVSDLSCLAASGKIASDHDVLNWGAAVNDERS